MWWVVCTPPIDRFVRISDAHRRAHMKSLPQACTRTTYLRCVQSIYAACLFDSHKYISALRHVCVCVCAVQFIECEKRAAFPFLSGLLVWRKIACVCVCSTCMRAWCTSLADFSRVFRAHTHTLYRKPNPLLQILNSIIYIDIFAMCRTFADEADADLADRIAHRAFSESELPEKEKPSTVMTTLDNYVTNGILRWDLWTLFY